MFAVYIYVISSMYEEVIIKLVEWQERARKRARFCVLLCFCVQQTKIQYISLEIVGVVFRIKFIIICLVNVIKFDLM